MDLFPRGDMLLSRGGGEDVAGLTKEQWCCIEEMWFFIGNEDVVASRKIGRGWIVRQETAVGLGVGKM